MTTYKGVVTDATVTIYNPRDQFVDCGYMSPGDWLMDLKVYVPAVADPIEITVNHGNPAVRHGFSPEDLARAALGQRVILTLSTDDLEEVTNVQFA